MPTPTTNAMRLIRVQSGKEVTWGTQVVASAKWLAIQADPQFKPILKTTQFEEDRGSIQPNYLSNVLETGGNFTINGHATFEDMPFHTMGMFGIITPTGAGPFIYTQPAPIASIPNLQVYSLEYGTDIASQTAVGCIYQKLTLKGSARKQWELTAEGLYKSQNFNAPVNIASSTNATPIVITTSTPHGLPSTGAFQVVIANHLVNTAANGTWIGTYVSATQFSLNGSTGNGIGAATGTVTRLLTPSLADRTVNVIPFPGTTFAMDVAAGAPGTTPFPNSLVSFQLELDNQNLPFFTGDSTGPVDWTPDMLKATMTLRLKWNAQVKAFYNATLSNGGRAVMQIKSTSGANICEIDFAGVLTDDPTNYQKEQNAITQEFKFSGQYDAGTLANSVQIITTNSVASLP